MLKKNLFIKVALGSLLIIFLRVELVFSDLLPTGGDMGAHIVPTKFFVTELFNNFKLSGDKFQDKDTISVTFDIINFR